MTHAHKSLPHLILVAALAVTAGCKSNTTPAPIASNDPANINMAPVAGNPAPYTAAPQQPQRTPTRVLDARDQGYYPEQGTDYPQGTYDDPGNPAYDQGYDADQPPPPLPSYAPPPAPRANTIWTPGYWAYSPRGYYWVPGAWVAAPYQGALWTPPYWQHTGPRYHFHPGYWGRHIGYYGGIPYGDGYPGRGFVGGYWNGPNFYYNQAVVPVGPGIPYLYQVPEPPPPSVRISFNGPGGLGLLPIAAEIFAMREHHLHPVRMQYEGIRLAGLNPAQFYIGPAWHPAYYASPEIYGPERYYAEPIPRPAYDEPEYRHDNGRHLGWYKHGGGDDNDQGERFAPFSEHHDNGNHNGWYKEHGDNGNHFGEYKQHGNPHFEGNDEGRGHGNPHFEGGGEGNGHGHGNGHGGGEGHGNGHGHGHD